MLPICNHPKQFLLPSKIISRHRAQFKGLITSPLVNQRERKKKKKNYPGKKAREPEPSLGF